ncbi:MAG: enoyl-CoA hydratase/isomerase family protein [Pseudomonadota bacterium]
MTTTRFIHSTRQDRVTTITIDRAAEGNRLSNAMALDLIAALDAAHDCPVVVLRAAGPDFCLGRDMQPPPPGSNVSALDVLRDDAGPMMALYDAFRRRKDPVIAVVSGKAWGIGLVLAAVCDMTIAARDVTFRLRELERGIPPCIAMAPLIDRIPAKALGYLVLSAEEMDAQAALVFGVVSTVVPAAELDGKLAALVERLLSFPPAAVAAVKLYLATAPRHSAAGAEHYGASLLANVLASR